MTLATQRGARILPIAACTLVLAAAGPAAGQGRGELTELPGGLGQGLIEPAGLLGVQVRRVCQHRPPGTAECRHGGVDRGQAGEPVRINDGVVGGGQGEQVGVVRGRQGPDEVQILLGQVGEVGGRVLPGVEHHREPGGGSHGGVAVGERVDDGGELGHVGPVARIRVGDDRDAAVAGDDQTQPDQAQIGALLLRVPALRDRRRVVAGVDEGREVRHVQRQAGQIQAELGHHPLPQPHLNLRQRVLVERVHRVPEPAVVQRRGRDSHPPVRRGRGPPFAEGELRAGRDDAVQRHQRQVGTHRDARVGAPRPDRLVDDPGHVQALQHRPHRRDVTEGQVLRPRRGTGSAVERGGDVLGPAQIPLRDDLRLPLHPRRLAQVVVGLPVDLLPKHTHHTLGHTPSRQCNPVPTHPNAPVSGGKRQPGRSPQGQTKLLARKLPLVYKSGFLPRILGVLLILDGVAEMIWFLQAFLLPAYPQIKMPGTVVSLLAEVGLALWLLIKGVKVTTPTIARPGARHQRRQKHDPPDDDHAHPRGILATAVRLGLGGAAGFWVTNFAISLTPIAAEYRAALGITYLPMLGEALLAGLIIGFGVSYSACSASTADSRHPAPS